MGIYASLFRLELGQDLVVLLPNQSTLAMGVYASLFRLELGLQDLVVLLPNQVNISNGSLCFLSPTRAWSLQSRSTRELPNLVTGNIPIKLVNQPTLVTGVNVNNTLGVR
jgi:hypothetical protein